jgi:YVTN family beta-propeller protein
MRCSMKVSLWLSGQNRKGLPEWLLRSLLITLVTCLGRTIPAAAQNTGNVASNPAIVYVTNTDGGITEINAKNNSVIATGPFGGIGAVAAVTPDGRRIYITDFLSAKVVVLDTSRNVPVAQVPVGSGTGNTGVAVTPDGSAVYVTSQFDGMVSVIATATNTVVKTIPTGGQPNWVTISPDGTRAYVSNGAGGRVIVVATASNSVIARIGGFTCSSGSRLARFESELLVSSPCDNTLKVVNTATNSIVNSIPTGPAPNGIAVTPDGTRAYVADFGGDTVDVIDLTSMTNLGTPITVGTNPRGLAIAPGGQLYVANFGNVTVSVIDTATNQVSATLHARGGPADVTISTTARPAILNYTFQPLDVPDSIRTNPQAINNAGQIVGSYDSSDAVRHGFLRQANGVFVTIDPAGSTLTVAIGISDLGVIVGAWEDASGRLHGFTQSPGGTFSIVDFPGAVDTALTGINDSGTIVGGYDLGDQTTNISFVLRQGVFTSFEDPAAASMQTVGNGINDAGVISGFYMDAAGNTHGFARGVGGGFQNYDFPGSTFTDATRINNHRQIVGGTLANFPTRGYILTLTDVTSGQVPASQFLSFDYPDSRNSSLHGINDQGQLVGFYRVFGSNTLHGFVATLVEDSQ